MRYAMRPRVVLTPSALAQLGHTGRVIMIMYKASTSSRGDPGDSLIRLGSGGWVAQLIIPAGHKVRTRP